MGNLKSRVERLEKEVFKMDEQMASNAIFEGQIKSGESPEDAIKDIFDEIENGVLGFPMQRFFTKVNSMLDERRIKSEKLKTCDSVEIKVSGLPTTTIVEVFKNSSLISTFNLRGLKVSEMAKKIKDISELNNATTVSFSNGGVCEFVKQEYLRLVNPRAGCELREDIALKIKKSVDSRAGYRLKQEIDLATAIFTLGEVQILGEESDPAIKKAKEMGLLDLWFNKVIK